MHPFCERENAAPAAEGKRVDTKVSTLLTPTSFCFIVWRRPETDDRSETENGRGFFSAEDGLPSESVLLSNLFAGLAAILLHRRLIFCRVRHSSAAQIVCGLLQTAPARIDCTKQRDLHMPCGTVRLGTAYRRRSFACLLSGSLNHSTNPNHII